MDAQGHCRNHGGSTGNGQTSQNHLQELTPKFNAEAIEQVTEIPVPTDHDIGRKESGGVAPEIYSGGR